MKHISVTATLFCFLLLTSTCVFCAYPCPYDGPAENPNELKFQVENYLIDLNIQFPVDPEEGYIEGHCAMDCVSLVTDLNQVVLDFYFDDDADVTGVTVDGSNATFTFADDMITIDLTSSVQPGDPISIDVTYRAQGLNHFKFLPKPPKTVLYGYNAMVEASRWFPCLHDPRDKALYEFRITTDLALTAACNGTLESDVDNGDGTRTATWIEHNPMATYLATVNVSEYTTFGHTWNSIPVIYYVQADSLADAQYDFQNDDSILDFFDSTFGPYPFEKMGLAQVKLPGAMENQDMISYGVITGDLANEDTFAHEISHMYWGNSVTLTGCEDVWLNEGFASYCEALWEEHFYGDEEYDTVMEDFRQRYFSEDNTHRYSIYDPENVWSNTTYRKGAWVLHMLRRIVGDATFFQILAEYYDRYKFTHAITPEFRAVCEELHGSSLDWFFQEWIYKAGYPEYTVYPVSSAGTQHLFIEQTQENAPTFRMPGTVEFVYADSTKSRHSILMESGVEYIAIPVGSEPQTITMDPDHSILSKISYSQSLPGTRCLIEMPSDAITTGDIVWCKVHVDNFSITTMENYPLFVILDVYGEMFFAPSFTNADYYNQVFPPGRTTITVLPEFTWPDGTGSAGNIYWYAGLTDPGMTSLFGELDIFEFGWN